MGRHRYLGGMDAGPEVSAAFAQRAFGASALVGKHLELTNRTPNHPGYRDRQARKLWAMLKRGALAASAIEDVRRRFAREFAEFEREEGAVRA